MKTKILFYLTFLAFFVYTGSALAGNEVGSNTYYGENAGGNITTGGNNTFFGKDAGFSNTSGNNNNFFGFGAGYSNTTQSYNTFFGHIAGYYNTSNNNTFFGYGAGYSNTSGFQNIYIGDRAGWTNDTGFLNTFIGPESGYNNTTGAENTFIGPLSGYNNDTGDFNTFIGSNAGFSNTSGYSNTFIGPEAGGGNTDGFENTFIGYYAGYSNDTGYYNTFLGPEAGYSNTTGNSNVFIGNQAGYNETGSNRLYIDNSDTSSPLIYGEFDNDILAINGDLFKVDGGKDIIGVGMLHDFYKLNVFGGGTRYWALRVDVNSGGSGTGHNFRGADFNVSLDSASGTDNGRGFNMLASHSGASDVSAITGGNMELRLSSSSDTSVTNAYGLNFRFTAGNPGSSTYTIDNLYGAYFHIDTFATGTVWNIENYRGLYLADSAESDFNATTAAQIWLDRFTAGTTNYGIVLAGDGAGADIAFGASQQVRMYRDAGGDLYVSGATICDQSCISDIKFKDNVRPIESSLDKIMKIEGVSYSWKKDEYKHMQFPEGKRYGVVAQEVEKILPEIVSENSRGDKSVAYKQLIPVLIEAMKEQQKTISDLTKEVKELKREMKLKGSMAMAETD